MSTADTSCKLPLNYGNSLEVDTLNIAEFPLFSISENERAIEEESSGSQTDVANVIVSEVIGDIVENALDIAMGKTRAPWIEQKKIEEQGIIEGICSPFNVEEGNENIMKTIFKDLMLPPYTIVNYETLPRKDGVGDQPSQVDPEKIEEVRIGLENTRLVEKKTRVTDLIMNKKTVISEFLINEESRKKQEEWEVANEQEIQVIELDCPNRREDKFMCKNANLESKPKMVKLLPEEIPLPDDQEYEGEPSYKRGFHYDQQDDEVEEILPLPDDGIMDIVDLSNQAFHNEEKHLVGDAQMIEGNPRGGKGDEYHEGTVEVQIVPQVMDISEEEAKILTIEVEDETKKTCKKCKWNWGNKLMAIIRRRSKRGECTSDNQ